MNELPDKLRKGVVFSIQKYSVHDGAGIRTIVFLKGCALRCVWCSNPESQEFHRELAYNPDKCLTVEACQRCQGACPRGALSTGPDGKIVRSRELCDDCLECVRFCPTHALNAYGYELSVDDALKRVEEDGIFYSRSGGGLTLSGGEPLAQADFAVSLLREARRRRINTCIETSGNAPWSVLEQAAPHLNQVFFDIKCMDEAQHREVTGASNQLILANLVKLRARFPDLPVTVRTPIVPTVNDNEQSMARIVDFVRELPGTGYEVLAYHRMGTPKYAYLGRPYPLDGAEKLPDERFAALRRLAQAMLEEKRDGRGAVCAPRCANER